MPLFKPKYWIYFTRSQRRGVLILLFLLVFTQIAYWLYSTYAIRTKESNLIIDKKANAELDSIYREFTASKEKKVYPYNPNYISDYKGLTLGMSVEEIDRLHSFRDQNKFVNSAKEFQLVTQVSDAWLVEHAVNFKFPEWVNKPRKQGSYGKYDPPANSKKSVLIVVKDLNLATKDDFMLVRGIGPAYSDRILKERDKFGGFVSLNQLDFVWGIPPEALDELKKHFEIQSMPPIAKLEINNASINEIKNLPYLNYYIAREIVKWRSAHGDFKSAVEFKEIKNFPLDKVDIIDLYLDFKN